MIASPGPRRPPRAEAGAPHNTSFATISSSVPPTFKVMCPGGITIIMVMFIIIISIIIIIIIIISSSSSSIFMFMIMIIVIIIIIIINTPGLR